MAGCTNKRIGDRLYAYELDLLKGPEREEFEIHLVECRFCLDRARRFQDAARTIRHDQQMRAPMERLARHDEAPGPSRSRITITALAIAAVLTLLILQPWQIEFRPTQEALALEDRLLVTTFDNQVDQHDSTGLGELLTNLLITDLSESRYVRVVSTQRLNDVSGLLVRQGTSAQDPGFVRQLAEATRSRWALTGSVVQVAPVIALTTQIVDLSSGEAVASQRITAGPDNDVFALVDSLTVRVKQDLRLPDDASREVDPPVGSVTTYSIDAYHYYIDGLRFLQQAYFDDAVRCFERALEFDSTMAMSYYYLAKMQNRDAIDKAVEYGNRASRKEQLYILSLQATLSGDASAARGYLEQILEQYPDDKIALFDLGSMASRSGRHAEAAAYFEQVLDIAPLNRSAYNALAYACANGGDVDQALVWIDSCIALFPDEPNPHDTRGDIVSASGQLDSAIASYERVYRLKPDFANYATLFKLSRLYIYRGDYSKAQDCVQEAAVGGERIIRSVARTYMGLIPMYQGKLAEAESILSDGIAADRLEQATTGRYGDRSMKHFIRSRIFVEQGRFKEAAAEMRLAIEVHHLVYSSRQPMYRCSLAQVLAEGGDFEGAAEIIDILREEYLNNFEPAQFAYWYASGCVELEQGQPTQAAASLEKAIEALPDYDGQYMLGRAYVEAGLTEHAIANLEAMMSNYPDRWRLILGLWTARLPFYLGLAYEQAGQTDRAVVQLETFLNTWRNADSCLTDVTVARDHLARLTTTP
ncbi:MAG: tetratricopeptide repeat protein [candidate division Zixibacteria bacterium]|nr:tetratricopeptide repeat protein [candidate division Zixibacteria bacterium]